MHLKGEMCIAVLKLLLTKYNEGAGLRVTDRDGRLPIHIAARESTLNVIEFLLQAYPESITELTNNGETLLHHILGDFADDKAFVYAKFQYVCDQNPGLLCIKDLYYHMTPLERLIVHRRLDLSLITIICQADLTILSDLFTGSEEDEDLNMNGMLPLHLIIALNYLTSILSVESDVFRLILRLYPAAVGVRDCQNRNVYNLLAISDDFGYDVDLYFMRLLLNADRAIAPGRRLDLNYEARREAMFLSFRALSTNKEASIW
eukprot:CAMPEP_0119050120 /NCGR_PEP_ID=MMETSP1177-20130426/68267_1 /TAXON_ID=2985 /ORGANISM="Ochromonas sp, Strain CCMP1899" /LENGTH=260 /DNA_ID=CAMNT_0007028145 /DNA_START=838 /DNA_END=1617 /DNA_ORIENTATION=+